MPSAAPQSNGPQPPPHFSLYGLALAAIGVVYGDIGTSPLYTMKEAFSGTHALAVNEANILGVLSLLFWAIMGVVSLKYVLFILRADNRGEGGILALMALAQQGLHGDSRMRWAVLALGVFGAGLFYGDSVITPAISVLSAVEGLGVVTPALARWVEPVTLLVLLFLFMFQRFGSARVGAVFSPVMVAWFLSLAVFGGWRIIESPQVLAALNPLYAVRFFLENGAVAFIALGAVVLALTGAEALYADMGHFGKRPIRWAWFGFVLPALLLNYFGQGAMLLIDPAVAENPFYRLLPGWALYPMIALATAAAVIASQAVITGAYSLTRQAIQLGLFPRSPVRQTSEEHAGQIYMPLVNWGLLLAVVAAVLGFRSSSHLAAAYGIAVTGTMTITTLLALIVARRLWHWPRAWIVAVGTMMLTIDLAFFGANAIKLLHGGWLPLVFGIGIFALMTTWRRGRQLLLTRLEQEGIGLRTFISSLATDPPHRVPGTAVFLSAAREGVPHALLHNLKHNKVLHEANVILTVETAQVPRVDTCDRVTLEPLGYGFHRLRLTYGFAEQPNVPAALSDCRWQGLGLDPMETTYFVSRERIIATDRPGMATWRDRLFAFMARNASSATDFFRIPGNRLIEIGTQVEI